MTAIVPVSTASAEHYRWGSDCDGWHLLRNSRLSVIAERMPAGSSEVAHRHAAAQQFFFVLSGSLVVDCGDTRQVLDARTGLHVPAGVAHQVRNESATPVEFLVISEPPSHGDRVDAALEAPSPTGA